ncbi:MULTISPECIES: helix-turn-helix transcriptional regulator [unclassified Clostridium]|uniref:helix-turn-helix domain-containing protein n=1 Tax=unclassified Clostridium TaxID=2614128 RepID=UPI000297C938|nr:MULTISPECIES: helix-turn-helix transcriptional regulator [unclassified Clostridium]EKQ56336.1 MAG: putative transcriptional regulator [Clostridium sp. Maddingley MBC34-26]
MNTLGDRLRDLRNEIKLEQKEFAKILNVHKGTVSNWENNKRSPDKEMISKIASYFNVTTDYLLCRTNDKNITVEIEPAKELAFQMIDELLKDGYTLTKDDIPDLVLAAKITLAQKKNRQDG